MNLTSALVICAALYGGPTTPDPADGCPPPVVSNECVHGVPIAEHCCQCAGELEELPLPGPVPIEVSRECCCDNGEIVERLNQISLDVAKIEERQNAPPALGVKFALQQVSNFHQRLDEIRAIVEHEGADHEKQHSAALEDMNHFVKWAVRDTEMFKRRTIEAAGTLHDELQKLLAAIAVTIGLLVVVIGLAIPNVVGKLKGRPYLLVPMLLAGLVSSGQAAGMSDCMDAVARVSVQGGIGTGCCFHRDDSSWYFLTNCHVAERPGTRCQIECWVGGFQSPSIPGVTISSWMDDQLDRDIAIVQVRDSAFPNTLRPKVIPLAPRGTKVPVNTTVCSVGCASGKWPTAWKGNVFDVPRPHVFHARPPAANGRSGSAVFDAECRYIVGLIAWRDDQAGAAVAQTIESLYAAFDGRTTVENYPRRPRGLVPISERVCTHGVPLTSWCGRCQLETQCGPEGCPPQYGGGYGPIPDGNNWSCGPDGCGPGARPQPDRGGDYAGGQGWRGFDPWRQGAPQQPAPLAPVTPVSPTPEPPLLQPSPVMPSELNRFATRDYVDQSLASLREHIDATCSQFATAGQVKEVSAKLDQSLAAQRTQVVKETNEVYRHVEEREKSILERLGGLVTKQDLAVAAQAAEQNGVRAAGAVLLERVGTLAVFSALGVSGPMGLAIVVGAWILRRRAGRPGGSACEPFQRTRRRQRQAA